ncbi:hypothetical protein K2173_012183 [Erythroxylum novogranatense]|uniref:Uncharacterized protein n=1 Tax=Erythroxylum novogranatense TaxID=1862640 RepID=A0AAV8SS72_9ROSI|nr:hypothetical protein K2173_012183 [Erythroxylum novogranatense]
MNINNWLKEGTSLFQTSKDKSSTSSQAWRRRKLLGGHCECFEKQAFGFVIINTKLKTTKHEISDNSTRETAISYDSKRFHRYLEGDLKGCASKENLKQPQRLNTCKDEVLMTKRAAI